MISKKSMVAVLDTSIILTITVPNVNANQDPVQCAGGQLSLPPVPAALLLSVARLIHAKQRRRDTFHES